MKKAKIEITYSWREGSPLTGEFGEVKKEKVDYTVTTGDLINARFAGTFFEVKTVNLSDVILESNNAYSPINDQGTINLFSDGRELKMELNKEYHLAPSSTDEIGDWVFKLVSIVIE